MTTILDRPLPPAVLDRPAAPVKDLQPTSEPTTPPRVRAAARLRRIPVDWPIVAGLLLLVGAVQGSNILRYPAIGADEGTYLAQAWAVREGLGLAHYTYWYDHPPVGWMQLAILSWLPAHLLPDALTVASGRIGMLAVSLVSAVLVYAIARRLTLPRPAAALAVVLYGLSPLAVTLQRQIYLDNIAVAWMLAAMLLALSPRKHMWHHVAAGTCAAVAVLSKETIILALPGVLVAAWQGSHPSTRKFSFVGFGCGFALVAAVYPLYAALNNELLQGNGHVSLLDGVLFQLHRRPGTGSMLLAGSDANQLLNAWLGYDPVLPLAGAAAVVLGLAVRRLRAPAVAGVVMVLMALRPGGYLPAMFVLQTLPFFALALAGLVAVATRLAVDNARWAARDEPGPTGPSWLVGVRPVRVPVRLASAGLVLAGLVVAGLLAASVVGPKWYAGDRRAMTVDQNNNYVAAVDWIRANVPALPHARIVVDDAMWLDLVQAGCQPGLGAIWFYKVDLDPAVRESLPNGWRDVDYLVSTPIVRHDRTSLPTVDALHAHSDVVAVFGSGPERIEIRRVRKESS